jgi:hypothetical protein
MSCGTPRPLLERNVCPYRWYAALFNAHCWAPVFFLYFNSILPLDRSVEFEQGEAVVARIGFVSMALASLTGGVLGMIDLRLAYGGSLAASAGLLFVTLRLAEPIPHREAPPPRRSSGRQPVVCTKYLRVRELRWLLIFALLMTVLHITCRTSSTSPTFGSSTRAGQVIRPDLRRRCPRVCTPRP